MFKQLGNIASIMRQAQQMGGRMQEITAQLRHERVEGTSGGAMIRVEADGLGEVLTVRIDPALAAAGDLEMIEELLPAAINDARQKAKQLHATAMQSMTAGLDVPGLDEAISKMAGESGML